MLQVHMKDQVRKTYLPQNEARRLLTEQTQFMMWSRKRRDKGVKMPTSSDPHRSPSETKMYSPSSKCSDFQRTALMD